MDKGELLEREVNHYGRPSVLRICTKYIKNRTFLDDAYFTPPVKVAKPFYKPGDDVMYLCILNSSAGLLAGDFYKYNINVGENSKLDIYTQSYTKIHKMGYGCAHQECVMKIEKGGLLRYLPLPTIPFGDSSFYGKNIVYMEEGANLIFSDVLASGRYKRGEAFEYKNYNMRTEVYYGGELVYLDNLVLRPQLMDLGGMGFYEGYTHFGALLIVGEKVNDQLCDSIYNILQGYNEIEYGITRTFKYGIVVRMLGYGGEKLSNVIRSICELHSK